MTIMTTVHFSRSRYEHVYIIFYQTTSVTDSDPDKHYTYVWHVWEIFMYFWAYWYSKYGEGNNLSVESHHHVIWRLCLFSTHVKMIILYNYKQNEESLWYLSHRMLHILNGRLRCALCIIRLDKTTQQHTNFKIQVVLLILRRKYILWHDVGIIYISPNPFSHNNLKIICVEDRENTTHSIKRVKKKMRDRNRERSFTKEKMNLHKRSARQRMDTCMCV